MQKQSNVFEKLFGTSAQGELLTTQKKCCITIAILYHNEVQTNTSQCDKSCGLTLEQHV